MPVMDETKLSVIYGNHPDDHVVQHNYYSYIGTKSFFFSLLPTTSQVKLANNEPALNSYPGLWKFKAMPDDDVENCFYDSLL